ncbi:hypothetical protein F5148DRAFT_911360 [Russula earlei]|uniref:Uncharacterized protein n=1 Tax=Russula earlei TaxID=71964 RepID=A0ACC0UA87_9AGAM|nr:hypothetical protein F5148DRAFT_911360 [Russula earlei]
MPCSIPSSPIQHRSSPTDSPFPHPNSTPPHPLKRALRFSANNDFLHKFTKPTTDHWSARDSRTRTFSMTANAKSGSKGKDPDAFDTLDSGSFSSSLALDDMVPFTKKSARASTLPRPTTADSTAGSPQRRYRSSILGVASDALRFGRRRRSIKELPPPPQPRLLVPDVIEVRASSLTPTFDEDEEAEREQLRAAAVQSVGFDVDISRPPDRQNTAFGDHQGDTNEKEDHSHANDCENGHVSPPISPTSLPPSADCSLLDSVGSTQPVRSHGRMSTTPPIRAAQHMSMPSTAPLAADALAFPSTRAQVAVHEQLSATLPKHYPPPSLLMLALSKQWKARHVVFSAPVLAGASYLHVFKSSAADERELERLEINERSVVFVNDEDVGGRRGVVRVGGVDVGALRRELNGEENGMTMMLLQIVDANESQNWINAIKKAVLGQRSVRAGLGIPSDSSGMPEPRGDLDVMLSMRKQGILPSPVKPSFNSPEDTIKLRHTGSSEEVSVTPRPPSIRSRPASPRAPNGVLSLKSLFSVSGSGSSRPRSPSSARTISPNAASGESLGSAANSLFGMRTIADSPLIKPYSMLPPTGPAIDPAAQLQRKIIDTQPSLDWAPLEKSRPPRPMSPSLNPPPPRRRAYTTNEPRQAPSSPDSGPFVYNHGNASTAGSFGIPVPATASPSMERTCSDRAKPRTDSMSSAYTTMSARRWSRQSSSPPGPTLTDEDSATPKCTVPQQPPWQNGLLASHESDLSPSRSSLQSQKTLPSFISGLHVASKRASTSSSVHSVATTNSNSQHIGSFSITRAVASHRVSVPPPPRPAPSTALPPTPTGSDTECPVSAPMPTVKTIRRNSLARRALRLSLGQPATSLPTHGYALHDGASTAPPSRSHSRSTSIDSVPRSSLSHNHVIPPAFLAPPSPPPTRPLPAPPFVAPTPTPTPLPVIPRTASLKQRLRILSVPSGRSTPPPHSMATVVPPVLSSLEIPTTMPVTPICERIAHIAPDADFLNLDGETPVATVPPLAALGAALFEEADAATALPPHSFPLPLRRDQYRPSLPPLPLPPPPPPQERSPQHMTVLSPPPRKGSIRPLPSPALPSPEQERGPGAARDDEGMLPLTPPPLDLARNTSTLSLSIVSGAV